MHLFQFLAVFTTILFTGAAIYINVAEHPARMECGMTVAVAVFGPSYRRAAVMQVILASVATLCAIGAWFFGASMSWLAGGLLIFAVMPFTLIVIMPTNKKLLGPTSGLRSDVVHGLLQQWGRLHAVRSILGLASSIVLLAALVWSS